MQSRKPRSWLIVLLASVVLGWSWACTIPTDDEPVPTLTPALIRELPPQSELPLGPLLSQGAFCWKDLQSGHIYIRMALFNPTQSIVRFRIDPFGTGPAKALQSTMTDRFDIGTTSECGYTLQVRDEDEGNSHLDQDHQLFLKGVTLMAPDRTGLRLVRRYFSDLQKGDVDSLQTYVDPSVNVQRLATSIAWRRSIGPVTFRTKECSPRFQHDELSRGSFRVLAYDCTASVVYSVFSQPPGSGTWNGTVTADYVEKKLVLYPDLSAER